MLLWRNKETILVVGKNALVEALYKNAPTVILVENSDNFSLQYYIETKVCVDAGENLICNYGFPLQFFKKGYFQRLFPVFSLSMRK